MVETFRDHVALALLLQCIITDLLRGVQCLAQVAGIKDTLLLGELAPDPGKAISLMARELM